MAELIWKNSIPDDQGAIGEYRTHGARVLILAGATERRREAGVPLWVEEAGRIMAARLEEYARATGRAASAQLIRAFDRDMKKALDAFLQDPMAHPFRPMSLLEYEKSR